MVKREKQRLITEKVIEFLIAEYNGADFEDEGGGRIMFSLIVDGEGFQGEYHRSYYNVNLCDTINLVGGGWTQQQLDHVKKAKELDEIINKEIKTIISLV